MIKAICFTTKDNIICPITSFVALPRIGDSVTVIHSSSKDASLRIVKITHKEREGKIPNDGRVHNIPPNEPYIEVELNTI